MLLIISSVSRFLHYYFHDCFVPGLTEDVYMLPADHPHVMAELERRADVKLLREADNSEEEDQPGTKRRKKAAPEKEPHDSLVEKDISSGTPKWKSHHIDLAEKRYMPKFGTFAKLAS